MKNQVLRNEKKIKILVISDVPWSDDNSVGNTLDNIFASQKDIKFANLYCKSGEVKSKLPSMIYQMNEKMIIKKRFARTDIKQEFRSGSKEDVKVLNHKEKWFYDIVRNLRFPSFFIGRELLWKIGKWKTKELDDFLADFSPDVIFSFCLDSLYYLDIIKYCVDKTNSKLVLYFVDDVYAYRGRAPLYILHQSFVRNKMKRLSRGADLLYGATPDLCEEYSVKFEREIYKLYKVGKEYNYEEKISTIPLKLTYAGNLFYGRWKVLALLAQAIKEINEKAGKQEIHLDIYTSGLYNDKIEKSLNIKDVAELKEKISYEEVKKVLKCSDIVLHVESFERKEIRKTRLSFSTKILDCMQSGSCLMAIGPKETASINILKQNNIAEVIEKFDKEVIKEKLESLLTDRECIESTRERMRKYAVTYHTTEFLDMNLYSKLDKII
jgi:hypothetical protein